jgi:cytochrome c2
MADRTRTLNLVFALTSIGLLIAFSLMVWYDYDREWKQYQLAFNKLEVKRTEAQIQEALGKVDGARRQELQAKLAQGAEEARARAQEIRKLEDELTDLGGKWYAADQNFRFTKAHIDVARYELEEARQQKKGSADRRRRELEELEKTWARYRAEVEEIEARRAETRKKLAELQKSKGEAEAIQKELFAEKDRLEARLDEIRPGLVSFVRNLPVLDLANPSLKINQVMPANLKDDVIFTQTEKVDRCTTCHLGIDKKGYEEAPQPFRTHPDMEFYVQGAHAPERLGCTSCHQGRGRATSFVKAAHTASSVEQEKAWGKYSGHERYETMHYWDWPMAAKGHTESQCAKCHQGVVEVPRASSLNTGRFLVERYGCHGCHKIKGWEDLRKVGPTLTRITGKTTEDWIYRWIKEPKGFRPTRMPQVWDVRPDETAEQKKRNDLEANAVAAYIVANAAAEPYPAPPSGDLAAGRQLVENVGCLGCHRVGDDTRGLDQFLASSYRAHGPNLDGSGTKLNAGWVYAWIRNPKGYWHDTRMPSLRLTEKEAADITAYLMSLTHDSFMARPRPAIDASLRDEIVREHLLGANMPGKEVEARLAAMDDRARTLFVGEKTIARYGCFGCHEIKGFEKANPIGVELTEQGSKLVERLDFGYEHGKIPHTLPGWLHRKVMEPRIFDQGKVKKPEELLRMPKFWTSKEEADAIVTAVLSFSKEQVPLAAQDRVGADERHSEDAHRLIREYNCRGCHQVGETGGSIRKVIEDQLEAAGGERFSAPGLSPPLLYNAKSRIGEGARVHSDWLQDFLADPSDRIRPWLTLRMPTFEFTERQLNTLTRGFAAMDGVPFPAAPLPRLDATMVAHGADLFARWQCVRCHVVAGRLPEGQDPANMAPDLARVPQRLRPDWLTLWLADPLRIQPGTRMPANFPKDPKNNAFPEILGGDQAAQIEAVRSYLLTLGGGLRAARPGALPAPRPAASPAARAAAR